MFGEEVASHQTRGSLLRNRKQVGDMYHAKQKATCVLHGMHARMHTWHKIVSDNMKLVSYIMGFDMSNECIKDYLVFYAHMASRRHFLFNKRLTASCSCLLFCLLLDRRQPLVWTACLLSRQEVASCPTGGRTGGRTGGAHTKITHILRIWVGTCHAAVHFDIKQSRF